jgi:hypothetical protein
MHFGPFHLAICPGWTEALQGKKVIIGRRKKVQFDPFASSLRQTPFDKFRVSGVYFVIPMNGKSAKPRKIRKNDVKRPSRRR